MAFPKTYSSTSRDAFDKYLHPGLKIYRGSWDHDAILEIPTEKLKCSTVIDDWNRYSSHQAVNETISPHLLGKTPS